MRDTILERESDKGWIDWPIRNVSFSKKERTALNKGEEIIKKSGKFRLKDYAERKALSLIFNR